MDLIRQPYLGRTELQCHLVIPPRRGASARTDNTHTYREYIHVYSIHRSSLWSVMLPPEKSSPKREKGQPRIADMLEISDRKHGMRRVRSGTSRDRYMYDPDALCIQPADGRQHASYMPRVSIKNPMHHPTSPNHLMPITCSSKHTRRPRRSSPE